MAPRSVTVHTFNPSTISKSKQQAPGLVRGSTKQQAEAADGGGQFMQIVPSFVALYERISARNFLPSKTLSGRMQMSAGGPSKINQ